MGMKWNSYCFFCAKLMSCNFVIQVASRRAFQVAGLIFVLCGLCGKFGALLTLLPDPVLGGIVLVSFGMVTAVGLSNLQFVSLQSSRNLVIIGSSLLIGLMAPRYISANPGCIKTGTVHSVVIIYTNSLPCAF